MKAKIVKQTDDLIGIEWECPEYGFGQMIIKYNSKGGYEIDAEYLGIENTLKIIQAIDLDDLF